MDNHQLIEPYLAGNTGLSHIDLARKIIRENRISRVNAKNLAEYISKARKELSKLQEKFTSLAPFLTGDPWNVLVIGDTHKPFERKGYLEHCREMQERFNCGTVVHIGDEVDNCAMSFHDSDPDGFGAGFEYEKAKRQMQEWYEVFPNVKVCIGNHTAIPFRKAFSGGIPKAMLKSYRDIWEAPMGWEWALEWELFDVLYTHGTNTSGTKAAINKAIKMGMSTVQGHIHTEAGVLYHVTRKARIFGMQVGCGINDKEYAFNYAKENVAKSVISCGVVLDRGKLPIVLPMDL